jgi:hypothetical protein
VNGYPLLRALATARPPARLFGAELDRFYQAQRDARALLELVG